MDTRVLFLVVCAVFSQALSAAVDTGVQTEEVSDVQNTEVDPSQQYQQYIVAGADAKEGEAAVAPSAEEADVEGKSRVVRSPYGYYPSYGGYRSYYGGYGYPSYGYGHGGYGGYGHGYGGHYGGYGHGYHRGYYGRHGW